MSDTADLERRYRRLLKCSQHGTRREHEQEILVAAVIRGRPGAADGALVCLAAAGALAQVAISWSKQQ